MNAAPCGHSDAVPDVFRPLVGRILTVAVAVGGVLVLVLVATTGGVADAVLTLPWVALFAVACWAVYWRPRVEVSDGGIRLVNVTRTIDVPWPAVTDVETRYALTLVTCDGRFRAWAAPAPGAGAALRAASRSRRQLGGDGQAVTPGEVPGTPSADAATVVRRRWARLRDAGHLDEPRLEFDAVPVRWHTEVAVAVVLLAALSAVTLLVS